MAAGGILLIRATVPAIPDAQQWLTATEAADETLPGFEMTARHIQRALKEGTIQSRPRAGRGGGREFHWTSLPREAQAEYLKRYGIAESDTDRADDPRAREALRHHRADARVAIVEAALAYIADHGTAKTRALKNFCKAFAKQKTKLPHWVYATQPAINPDLVRAWERTMRVKGAGALIDGRGRPAQSGVIGGDDSLRNTIASIVMACPTFSAPQIRDQVKLHTGREIALRTLQAFLRDFRESSGAVIEGFTNPDAFRSHHRPAYGTRTPRELSLNALWEMDATRGDAMCILPDGQEKRMAITAVIDVCSRRALTVVSHQPSAAATRALLRRAIMAWGVPAVIKGDNGREFKNRAVIAFCRDAGIELTFCRPYSPQEKPHMERFFGTLNSNLFPLFPGYVGRDVVMRKGIEARRSFAQHHGEERRILFNTTLAPDAMQARIDAWLSDVYEQREHGTLGMSPRDKAISLAETARFLPDERTLDALLLDAPDMGGIRIVGSRGIRIGNRFYIHPELGAVLTGGKRVHCRFDPADMSRIVVYTADRARFICVAVDAQAIPNEERMRIARQGQAVQRQAMKQLTGAASNVLRLFKDVSPADRLLADARGDGFILQDEARQAMDSADAPRLAEHRKALDAIEQSKNVEQPRPATAEETAAAREMIAEMTPRLAAAPSLIQCDGYSRPFFERDIDFWLWAEAHRASGAALDDGDKAQFKVLRESSAFQIQLLNFRADHGVTG